jgi:MFS superfamily sulfate permease-like transporter
MRLEDTDSTLSGVGCGSVAAAAIVAYQGYWGCAESSLHQQCHTRADTAWLAGVCRVVILGFFFCGLGPNLWYVRGCEQQWTCGTE